MSQRGRFGRKFGRALNLVFAGFRKKKKLISYKIRYFSFSGLCKENCNVGFAKISAWLN